MKETKFKQTEIGMIPDDWEVKKLGGICKSIASGKNKNKYPIGKFVVFGSTGIIGYTNQAVYTKPSILVARVGANAGLVNKVEGSYDVSDNTLIISGVCNDINFITEKLKYGNLNKLVFGSGQPLITGGQLRDIKLSLPPTLAEQQKIAKALSDVDNVISTLEKLITKKKNLKQGTMQQLLTGKKRLPGFAQTTATKQTELGEIPADWEVKELGEVCKTSSGGTPSRENKNNYLGSIKWFTTSELKDCLLYDSNEHISENALRTSSAKLFKSETILMAMYGATIGKLGILKTDASTNQACCAIICEKINRDFLYHFLRYNREFIISLGSGAGQPNISQNTVKKLSVIIPSKPEQTAIANVLSSMDKEIEALETKLGKYRNLKTGMMQQLLTGKIRLV